MTARTFSDLVPKALRQALDDAIRFHRLSPEELIAGLEELVTAPAGKRNVSVAADEASLGAALERVRRIRAIAKDWAEEIGEVPDGDIGRLVNHLLVGLATDLAGRVHKDIEAVTPTVLRALASGLRDLESAAKLNAERSLKLRQETAHSAAQAAAKVARDKGLSRAAVEEIERKILGIARGPGAARSDGVPSPDDPSIDESSNEAQASESKRVSTPAEAGS